MTTTDEEPTTPAPNGANGDGIAETPSAPPPDPRKEALRKHAGLLLQHKVRSVFFLLTRIEPSRADWTVNEREERADEWMTIVMSLDAVM